MDYRIDFSAAEDTGIVRLMSALTVRSDRLRRVNDAFTIDDTTLLRPASDGSPAIYTSGMTDQALFHLLDQYFAQFKAEEAGALVTVLNAEPLTMVAITAEADADFGPSPLGFVVQADEILSSPQVFAAAWPNLVFPGDDNDESEHDTGVTVTTANTEDAMIFASLLSGPEAETETVSFLIFGATPKAVMEDLVAATTYIAADPEFLTLELVQSGEALDVVSFHTSDGPAVELRLPLKQAQINSAIALLAERAPALPNARIFYVTEIHDDEELSIIQHIESDGFLAEPRRVTLH